MKMKWVKAGLIVLLGALLMTALAACGGKKSAEYDYLVTFDYNYPYETTNERFVYRGAKEGATLIIGPGEQGTASQGILPQYVLEGWYLPQGTNAEGEPLKGEDGRVLLGKKWDFKTDRVTSDITLYANIFEQASIVFVDAATDEICDNALLSGAQMIYYQAPGTEYTPLDMLFYTPGKAGHTFIDYYVDKDCTELFSWPYVFEAGVQQKVYVRFAEGSWNVVRTAKEFNTAFAGTNNVWLAADIDFSETAFVANKTFGGKLEGDGHKLTGIDVTLPVEGDASTEIGLIGKLEATAVISNLTIENAKITANAPRSNTVYSYSMFAASAAAGAQIKNVTVTGQIVQGTGSGSWEFHQFIAKNDATVTDCDYTGVTVPQV